MRHSVQDISLENVYGYITRVGDSMLYVSRLLDCDESFVLDRYGVDIDVAVSDTKIGRVGVFNADSLINRGVAGLRFQDGKCVRAIRLESIDVKFLDFVSVDEPIDGVQLKLASSNVSYCHKLCSDGVVEYLDTYRVSCKSLYRYVMSVLSSSEKSLSDCVSMVLRSSKDWSEHVIYFSKSEEAQRFYTKAMLEYEGTV